MQDLPIRRQFDVAPKAPLNEEVLRQRAAEFHMLRVGDKFKVVGSELEFRLDPSTVDKKDKWKRAYCVTPGKTSQGYPHKDITILTQGTHAMSPYLDFPYICYIQGDVQKDPYSVVNRFKEPGDTDHPVLDVRNPYKPKRLLREEVKKKCTNETFVLSTRYGQLEVFIYNTDHILRTAVYIPSLEIVANLFRTANRHGLELQCIFNVGNSFLNKQCFPVKVAGCFSSEPMISLRYGEFTDEGLWINSKGKWVTSDVPPTTECNCTFIYP